LLWFYLTCVMLSQFCRTWITKFYQMLSKVYSLSTIQIIVHREKTYKL
jgi:hypothetical protein